MLAAALYRSAFGLVQDFCEADATGTRRQTGRPRGGTGKSRSP
jgi:hypothetical protein